jgi:hypothetical protein
MVNQSIDNFHRSSAKRAKRAERVRRAGEMVLELVGMECITLTQVSWMTHYTQVSWILH